jgi:hypothetical protein
MTILKDLFYSNIDLNIGSFDKDSEYGKAMQTIADNEEKLLVLLNGTEKGLFLDFTNAQSSLNNVTAEENFIHGFRLGALIMIEVMGSPKLGM